MLVASISNLEQLETLTPPAGHRDSGLGPGADGTPRRPPAARAEPQRWLPLPLVELLKLTAGGRTHLDRLFSWPTVAMVTLSDTRPRGRVVNLTDRSIELGRYISTYGGVLFQS